MHRALRIQQRGHRLVGGGVCRGELRLTSESVRVAEFVNHENEREA